MDSSPAPASQPALPEQDLCWTPEQKRALAQRVDQLSDLLRYCLQTSRTKFDGLVESEESFRSLATTLFISALKGENR